MQQDYYGAIAQFTKVLMLKPDDAYAYNDRGSCYRMVEKYTEALKDYEEAARKNPNLAFVLNNVGTTRTKLKMYQEALAAFNRALSVDPNFYLAYNNRGVTHSKMSRLDDAMNDFTKAIEINPNYAPAYSNRAGIYFQKGEYEKAKRCRQGDFTRSENGRRLFKPRNGERNARDLDGACEDWQTARDLGSDLAKNYHSGNCSN